MIAAANLCTIYSIFEEESLCQISFFFCSTLVAYCLKRCFVKSSTWQISLGNPWRVACHSAPQLLSHTEDEMCEVIFSVNGSHDSLPDHTPWPVWGLSNEPEKVTKVFLPVLTKILLLLERPVDQPVTFMCLLHSTLMDKFKTTNLKLWPWKRSNICCFLWIIEPKYSCNNILKHEQCVDMLKKCSEVSLHWFKVLHNSCIIQDRSFIKYT